MSDVELYIISYWIGGIIFLVGLSYYDKDCGKEEIEPPYKDSILLNQNCDPTFEYHSSIGGLRSNPTNVSYTTVFKKYKSTLSAV